MIKKILLIVTFVGCVGIFGLPQAVWSQEVYSAHTHAELIPEVKSAMPGQPFWVVLRLKPDPEWHTYWKNPGDSGLATTIKWGLPAGFQVGPIQWPFPEKIEVPPLVGYGYSQEVFLFTQIYPPRTISNNPNPKEIAFAAHVDWLTCKVECIPGKADFNIVLPLRVDRPEMNTTWALPFAQARAKLPRASREWKVLAEDREHEYVLSINPLLPGLTIDALYFFPERDDLIDHAAKQELAKTEQGYALTVKKSKINTKPRPSIQGVLLSWPGWHGERSFQALTVDAPVAHVIPVVKETNAPVKLAMNLSLALIFAFLGGLILNLMPCVLPVLSLKILSLTQQERHQGVPAWRHGIAYSFGVVIAFWFLAGLLIFLRGIGQQIGWGFQFQSPVFLIILIIVFLLFSLNLLGVFEIGTLIPQAGVLLRNKKGTGASFYSGLLATLVATPCTAPFMGTAIGFAITQSTFVAFLIFTFLGLGMALPFFILSCFPGLLRFIPKPGPWMVRFKQFLGLLLLLTVVWLVWVLAAQFAMKNAKDRQTGEPSAQSERLEPTGKITWQKYSPQLVTQVREAGKIVFIDFTAAWCLTCKVNERLTLDNAKVVQKFRELGIVAVKADWTTRSNEITQALAALGKNSIPLYVIYNKTEETPVILPEIITPAIVLQALEKVEQKKGIVQ